MSARDARGLAPRLIFSLLLVARTRDTMYFVISGSIFTAAQFFIICATSSALHAAEIVLSGFCVLLPARIASSSSSLGYPIDILIEKRSSCASGRGYVPTYPVGFCVAMTKKGSGRRYVIPSTVTLFSSIASRRLDCVLGEARLISSARRMLVITRPSRNSKRSALRLYILNPVMSDAMTSGVNCARLKSSPAERARADARVVFPTPGTSSMRMCPPESIAERRSSSS